LQDKIDTVDKKIGKLVLLKRKELGLNQQQVADIIGISKDYVSKIEKGDREPSKLVKRGIDAFLLTPDKKRHTEKYRKFSAEVLSTAEKEFMVRDATTTPTKEDREKAITMLEWIAKNASHEYKTIFNSISGAFVRNGGKF